MACKKFRCSCYLYMNYFVPAWNLHLNFDGYSLEDDAVKELLSRGISFNQIRDATALMKLEYERRKNCGEQSLQRMDKIQRDYSKLHPHLYSLQEEFFDPEFLNLVKVAQSGNFKKVLSMITQTSAVQVWQFPVFKETFCDEFVDELCHFDNSDMPKGRPNTMNNHGVLLNELGFDPNFLNKLRTDYLSPIARMLLPEWFGEGLDSHKAFTVKYKFDEDIDLSYHFDNAEISLNVCLGKQFDDGSLYFGNMRTEPADVNRTVEVKHRKGHGILHRGQHRHGAMPIEGDGAERHNLIIWMRASSVRNLLCPMCNQEPKLVEELGINDGFTDSTTFARDATCTTT